ncbi:hypothetical protein CU633_09965 [Bacillus sp. V3-13]|nr:hypothetical protein CU633_09965 [Bacillus sp. V3-13]
MINLYSTCDVQKSFPNQEEKLKFILYRQRMAKDVWDVKRNFGRKYNQGLKEAVRYGQKVYRK